MPQYIYLLRGREFIRLNESTYKIGKTRQDNSRRFSQYPTNSEIIIHIKCDNCDQIEKDLLIIFKRKFTQKKKNTVGNILREM